MTKVVNIRKDPYDIYCGRAGCGQNGYFGNPYSFKLGRAKCIAMFEQYFYIRLDNDPDFKNAVLALKDKILGCFCKPLDCHCDIIAEYLNRGD